MRFSAVILAGGKGERFKSSVSKQLMSLNGKPVLQYCLDVIEPWGRLEDPKKGTNRHSFRQTLKLYKQNIR